MREILFRGKRTYNGEWVYGDLLQVPKHNLYSIFGQNPTDANHRVIPSTIGQYTGLTDKNGVKIFEGDIINCTNYHGAVAGIVDFNHGTYYLACSSGFSDEYLFNCSHIEVIGNIHDNPELLKEGELG